MAIALALATLLCILPLVAPHSERVGIGEQFVLYRRFGLPRTQSELLGIVIFISAGLVFLRGIRRWRGPPAVRNAVRALGRYYHIDIPRVSKEWPRHDTVILIAIAILIQAIYVAAIPLGFECDGGMFYAYAKAIVGEGGAISYYRPPLFPVFVILTGMLWPKTFVVEMLAQAAMGVAIPVLTYRCLYGLGRWPAWIGAVAVMASTISFTAAKLFMSEQLYAFLAILTFFQLARYSDSADPRAIYAFALSALATMLTRWEGEIVLIFGFCAILVLARGRSGQLRHALLAIFLILVTVGAYSLGRAVLMRDPTVIGSLQSGTGGQLFHRIYTAHPDQDGEATGRRPEAQFVSAANGPSTARLKEIVVEFAERYPDSYRSREEGLSRLPVAASEPTEGIYQKLFGRFEGDPQALADNIFQSREDEQTAQYVFYVVEAAQHALGVGGADRLLLAVAIESIRAHPELMVRMMTDSATFVGLGLPAVLELARDPLHFHRWQALFPIWDQFSWDLISFDVGGCASAVLPTRMMAEYRFDQMLYNPSFHARTIEWGSLGRNWVRVLCGGILIAGWWLLFLSPRRWFNLALLASLSAMIVLTGIAVGGANGKYEYVTLPLLVMTAVTIIAEASRRLKRLTKAGLASLQ